MSEAGAGVLGLLGGTFDPVHRAHLALASAALESGAIDCLRIVPAGRPPHRSPPSASGAHRLAMVRLALATLPPPLAARCEVDAGEVESDAPSYTIDTLERLRREVGPTRPLALILGADAFLGLPTWHRWAELLSNAHLLITERPGHPLDRGQLPPALQTLVGERFCARPAALAQSPAGLIAAFAMPAFDVSATQVRARLAAGEGAAAAELLPADVVRYIQKHRLYDLPHGHPGPAENRH
jgi:nicotinate-nucleotide adenylyltransferase